MVTGIQLPAPGGGEPRRLGGGGGGGGGQDRQVPGPPDRPAGGGCHQTDLVTPGSHPPKVKWPDICLQDPLPASPHRRRTAVMLQ